MSLVSYFLLQKLEEGDAESDYEDGHYHRDIPQERGILFFYLICCSLKLSHLGVDPFILINYRHKVK